MKPTHFDLTVQDVGRAKTFFEKILGWRLERFDMPYEYFRIQAGPDAEPGIDGGIGAVKDAPISEGKPMTRTEVTPNPSLKRYPPQITPQAKGEHMYRMIEVKAATQGWADAFNECCAERASALYAPDAAFWGTTSPSLITTPAAVRRYFDGACSIERLGVAYTPRSHPQ